MQTVVRRSVITAGAALVAAVVASSYLDAVAASKRHAAERDCRSTGARHSATPSLASADDRRDREDATAAGRVESGNTVRSPLTAPGTKSTAPAAGAPDDDTTPGAETDSCAEDYEQAGCRFLQPDADTLSELARCGQIRIDFPGFLMSRESVPDLDEAWADAASVTDDERAALAEVGEAFRTAVYTEVVDLTVEAGRDRSWADQTPLIGLIKILGEVEGAEQQSEAAMLRVARERAGLQPPPSPDEVLSWGERHVRIFAGLGPRFEELVAERLGQARAAELRTSGDGWPGVRMQTAAHCED